MLNAKLSILTDPHPLLRQRSTEVDTKTIATPAFKKFVDALTKAMFEYEGVGIAAPQIGKPWRVFIVNTKDGPQTMINPEIISKSWRKEWDEEGCLSVPGKFGLVKRAKSLKLRALDVNGQTITLKAKGFFARVVQHEIDHLNGVLFIDKAKNISPVNNHGVKV